MSSGKDGGKNGSAAFVGARDAGRTKRIAPAWPDDMPQTARVQLGTEKEYRRVSQTETLRYSVRQQL